jgi:hypothetical protein
MIIYDLRCRGEHTFEGWFKNREIFERQRTEGLIACPVCGDTDPVQVPTPPAIMGCEARAAGKKPETGRTALKTLQDVCEYVQKNFDDVGEKFADTALRIHHGEEDRRNIRGTTTQSEEQTLREEGVPFIKIPLPKYDG